jgi:hypothetical protein
MKMLPLGRYFFVLLGNRLPKLTANAIGESRVMVECV